MTKKTENKQGHANLFKIYIDDYSKKGKLGKINHKTLSEKKNIDISKTTQVRPIGTRTEITIKTKNDKFLISQDIIKKEVEKITKQFKLQNKSDDYKIFTRVSLPQRYYTFEVDGDSGYMEGYADGNPSLI